MNNQCKAIFLDRDGVINKKRDDYVKNLHELEILPNIERSIQLLRKREFVIVVITNQSAINRNLTTHHNVLEIHDQIQKYLQSHGTYIDKFYYCPHRPDERCDCRKPKPGLLIQAANELKIDLKSSWLIGDTDSDVAAAKAAGCKAIKITTNSTLDGAIQEIINSDIF